MLEIIVLALPIVVAVLVVVRLRGSARSARTDFAVQAAANGWALPESGELRLALPIGGLTLQLEPFRERVVRSHLIWLGGRVTGLEGAPDVWLRTADAVALPEVPAGMVEVPLEPWFTRHYRVFAHDPDAFRAWCREDVRRALARSRVVRRLEVVSGTLTLRATHMRSVRLLDRVIAIATALADPSARPKLDILDVPQSHHFDALGGAVMFLAPVFFLPIVVIMVPLTDFPPGRVIAAPVLCPHGGEPETVDGSRSDWTVRCRVEAGQGAGPAGDVAAASLSEAGLVPGCRLPTFTAVVLSFEVYLALYIGLMWGARRLPSLRRGR